MPLSSCRRVCVCEGCRLLAVSLVINAFLKFNTSVAKLGWVCQSNVICGLVLHFSFTAEATDRMSASACGSYLVLMVLAIKVVWIPPVISVSGCNCFFGVIKKYFY